MNTSTIVFIVVGIMLLALAIVFIVLYVMDHNKLNTCNSDLATCNNDLSSKDTSLQTCQQNLTQCQQDIVSIYNTRVTRNRPLKIFGLTDGTDCYMAYPTGVPLAPNQPCGLGSGNECVMDDCTGKDYLMGLVSTDLTSDNCYYWRVNNHLSSEYTYSLRMLKPDNTHIVLTSEGSLATFSSQDVNADYNSCIPAGSFTYITVRNTTTNESIDFDIVAPNNNFVMNLVPDDDGNPNLLIGYLIQ